MPAAKLSTKPNLTVIEVEGLVEFRRGLKKVSDDLPKLLKQKLKKAAEAAEFTAVKNYSKVYNSRSGGHIGTIKIRVTGDGVALAFGGTRFPAAGGQEFGSNRIGRFRPWTGPGPGGRGSMGRVIFPAVREEAEQTLREIEEAFDDLVKAAFPEP